MGMTVGNGSREKANINMTPMIDVLLVLIIIFMVIAPERPLGLNALVPQASEAEPAAPAHDVVITVLGDRTVRLNQEPVELAGLQERLTRLFRDSPNRVVFVRGERELEFQPIAEVINIAHDAGIDRVALMTN